jgi:hypothetical protein
MNLDLSIPQDVHEAVLSLAPFLKELRSFLMRLTDDGVGAQDATFKLLAAHCPKLEHVQFKFDYDAVTDEALVALGTGCPNLQIVEFNNCHQITDVGLSQAGDTSYWKLSQHNINRFVCGFGEVQDQVVHAPTTEVHSTFHDNGVGCDE